MFVANKNTDEKEEGNIARALHRVGEAAKGDYIFKSQIACNP